MHYFLNYSVSVFRILTICIMVIAITFCGGKTEASVATVVLDPGHGGDDFGAKGADNTLEKNITLHAATLLKSFLDSDYNVILTRTGDYGINTDKRTETANTHNAKLFVSIHTGAGFARETSGISLFYYKPSPMHNGNRVSDASSEIMEWESIQEQYTPFSRNLANALHKRLSTSLAYGVPVKAGLPISVLAGATMPSVFIEIGHISNPAEEQRLNNPDFLSDYMREIASEIKLYLKRNTNMY